MRRLALLLAIISAAFAEDVHTFSIVGYDPVNHDWGVAVASRYFSVGSVVPWAEANVGAIATQADVNVGYGPRGLELLRQGLSAQQVLDKLLAEDTFPGKDGRQVGIIDRDGNVVTYTGPNAPDWHGGQKGKTWAAQGNTLVGPQVPEAMGKTFEATQGELAEKLFAALKAGDDAGGDNRGKQSASMLIVRKGGGRNFNNDRYLYLNVDDNPAPIPELRRLLNLQLAANYQGKLNGDPKVARDAAAKIAQYTPSANAFFTLGLMDYNAGDKAAALTDLHKAFEMDANLKQRFTAPPAATNQKGGGGRNRMRAILEDKEFLAQLLGN